MTLRTSALSLLAIITDTTDLALLPYAHATCEIVNTCPNHPMLMLSLLGVALIHGLHTESKIFLHLFLTALMRSP